MNTLIDSYLKKGFGSMTKNDFEVAIFNELLKDDEYKDLSDYKLSVKLRVPETKIKRLRYEVNLKYSKDENYTQKFLDLLSKSKVYNEGKTIKIIVEDKSIRQYIKDKMYENNMIIDTSFNSDLIITNIDDLKDIVKLLLGEEKSENVVARYNKEVTKDKVKQTFKEVLLEILNGCVSGVSANILKI